MQSMGHGFHWNRGIASGFSIASRLWSRFGVSKSESYARINENPLRFLLFKTSSLLVPQYGCLAICFASGHFVVFRRRRLDKTVVHSPGCGEDFWYVSASAIQSYTWESITARCRDSYRPIGVRPSGFSARERIFRIGSSVTTLQ